MNHTHYYPTSPSYDRASPTPSSPSSPAPSHDGTIPRSKAKKPAPAARLPESLLSSTIDFPKPKTRKKQASEVGSPGPSAGEYHNALPSEDIVDEETSEEDEAVKQAREDPLAAQIWRLYTKAKDSLPNGQRLENLTWRMMAMTLHKKNKEKEDKERAGHAMDLERPVPATQPSFMDAVSSKPMPSMSINIPAPNQHAQHNNANHQGLYDTTMQSDSEDDHHDTQSNASSAASSPREMRFSGIPIMTPIKAPSASQNANNPYASSVSPSSKSINISTSNPTATPSTSSANNNNLFHNNAAAQSPFQFSKSPTGSFMNGLTPSPTNSISVDFSAGATGSFGNSNGNHNRPALSRSSTGSKSGHSSSRNSTQRLSSYHGKVCSTPIGWGGYRELDLSHLLNSCLTNPSTFFFS
ncbi:hypothetical protein B0O80DRAFT_271735 [Mortierella sp. GBAus27b]|nr:hypothetical protein B0O80DRAFT_271735 [Mortierella sp. GBAus27b]